MPDFFDIYPEAAFTTLVSALARAQQRRNDRLNTVDAEGNVIATPEPQAPPQDVVP